METKNTAIIQDDVLLAIIAVLEHGYAPGPAFVSALSALAEAVVLHERVYFDVAGDFGREPETHQTITDLLRESSFLGELIAERALAPFPAWRDVESTLQRRGIEYSQVDFLQDAKWRLDVFVPADAEGERTWYVRQAFLMTKYPGVYGTLDLVDNFSRSGNIFFHHAHAAELASRGMPVENLVEIEGYNHAAKAYTDVARHLGSDLYMYNTVFPHQCGAIESGNTLVRKRYQEIVTSFTEQFDDVGESAYDFVEVPPLTRLLLARCGDASRAIATELLALRDRYRPFRSYLVSYEEQWSGATTVQERLRLKSDFKAAWKQLAKQHDTRRTRLIYVLWDLLKEPTKLLTKIGDVLAVECKKQSVVGRIRGLNTFWRDMLETPLDPGFQRLFKKTAPEAVWSAARVYGKVASKYTAPAESA